MLGDAILDDWRKRTQTGTARVRAYYDVIPDRVERADARRGAQERVGRSAAEARVPRRARVGRAARADGGLDHARCSASMAKAGDGTVLRTRVDNFQDHPAGGCRMGSDPASSVVDSWGRSARSRESVRRRRADVRERQLRERDADVLRAVAALGARDGARTSEESMTALMDATGRRASLSMLAATTAQRAGRQRMARRAAATSPRRKYSTLTDINRGERRAARRAAWEWATGETPNAEYRTRPGNFQATPLMIGDTLFLSTSYNRVVALDANTGTRALVVRSARRTPRASRRTAPASSIAASRRGPTARSGESS